MLKKICWYAVLAPTYSTAEGSSSDVLTLLTTTANDKKLSELPLYRQLLTTFQNPEIIRWNLFESQYGADMTSEVAVFAGEGGAKRREDLRLRVIEHNIMVVSKYYTRITITRLAELLNLPKDEVGDTLNQQLEAHLLDFDNCHCSSSSLNE